MTWAFISAAEHNARMDHCCDQCGTAIRRGTRYRRVRGRLDGALTVLLEHTDCRAAWEHLNFDLRGLEPAEGAPFLAEDVVPTALEIESLYIRWPAVARRMGWIN